MSGAGVVGGGGWLSVVVVVVHPFHVPAFGTALRPSWQLMRCSVVILGAGPRSTSTCVQDPWQLVGDAFIDGWCFHEDFLRWHELFMGSAICTSLALRTQWNSQT